jgi:hypothetical protein
VIAVAVGGFQNNIGAVGEYLSINVHSLYIYSKEIFILFAVYIIK